MSESSLLQDIISKFSRGDVRLFRNNCGMAYYGKIISNKNRKLIIVNPTRVVYGLAGKGSSDLIGWKSVIITPDMIGEKLAIFTAIEVKSQKGRLSPAQLNFINQVNLVGGIACVARDVDDITKIFGEEE